MRIAIDAMGGDYAPQEVLKGVSLALKSDPGLEIVLVGKKETIEAMVREEGLSFNYSLLSASEEISMGEKAVISVRRKKDSSIVKGIQLLKEGRADAFISFGNTGAVVAASTLYLGLIEGVERAGIALVYSGLHGPSLIIDVGANIDAKPQYLFKYGIMASIYAQEVLGIEKPRIGLLNIGEEESKGTGFIKEVHALFERSSLNFIGNVEGKDIFRDICDCIICDGFVGNITLKVAEGTMEAMGSFLVSELKSSLWGRLSLLLGKGSFERLKRLGDYAEYGGAPLLGINGLVIIGHGRSRALAVKNAIRVAKKEIKQNITEKIQEKINVIG